MPQPKAFDASGIQFGWDSTSIKLAEECLYKYKLKMIDGWQPETLSVHLRFGQHYATALEHYHKHIALGIDHDEAVYLVVKEALEDTWDRVYEEVSENEGIEGLASTKSSLTEISSGPWESDHNVKTRANLIRTIIWYLEQFGKDDAVSTLILSDGVPAVEHSFALPVDNGIVFAGHLDRLGVYAGDPYVQDQKTTGATITQRYFEGFNPDTQMSMYTFAGKVAYGIPVKGVIIDAAQIAVGFSRFERGFTFRVEAQLNEWYDHTMYHIEVARKATRENFFPMNRSSCGNYGGCEFRDICSRAPSVREQFLKAKYIRGPRWDPLTPR